MAACSPAGSKERALTLGAWLQFFGAFHFSIVIPDSYGLAAMLGRDAGYSGQMVGIYWLVASLGALCAWAAKRGRPLLWRTHARICNVAAVVFCVVGSGLYLSVTCLLADWGRGLPLLLLAARGTSGFGMGMSALMNLPMIAHLCPVSERPTHAHRYVMAQMIGIGLGPFGASMGNSSWLVPLPSYEIVGVIQAVVALATLAAVVALFPALDAFDDQVELARQAASTEGREAGTGDGNLRTSFALEPKEADSGDSDRRLVVSGCVLLGFMRGFAIAGLGVAVAQLLELEFQWLPVSIGVAVSAAFSLPLPAQWVFSAARGALSTAAWVRVMSVMACLGCVLLFRPAGKLVGAVPPHLAGDYCLLLAGGVIFAAVYLADAMSLGILQQHVLPHGSLFDANHAALWMVLGMNVSRFLGSWLSRGAIVRLGQDGYAGVQLGVCAGFLLVFETMVQPRRLVD